jgi:hypothetical protein
MPRMSHEIWNAGYVPRAAVKPKGVTKESAGGQNGLTADKMSQNQASECITA